jgi:septum formation protein
MKKVILASQSPQRKKIFSTLGIEFEIKPADIDEQAVAYKGLKKRAANIALAKAWSVQQRFPKAIIIGADTYPVFKGKALEKPKDLKEAKQMLKTLSGQKFNAYTGYAYLDKTNNIAVSEVATTKVEFRKLSTKEINIYVENNPVTTWSAAFCPAYDEGMALIKKISGSFTAFTHGLPIEEISPLLKKSGVKF